MDLDQYIQNKRKAEKRAEGYVEYAAVVIEHTSFPCNCEGDNPACRQVVKREWRKPAPQPKEKT